jgi:hypothetical protein
MKKFLLILSIITGLQTSALAQEVMSDAVGQAEVGVAYKGRIFICTLGNNFIAASGKNYLNTTCYLTQDNAARDASKK